MSAAARTVPSTIQGYLQSGVPTAYVLRAADGVATYTGFSDDDESQRARAWLAQTLRP